MSSERKPPATPVIALRDIVPFPRTELTFFVGRKASEAALKAAGKRVVLVSQLNPDVDQPKAADLFSVGALADLIEVSPGDNESTRVVAMPSHRVLLKAVVQEEPYLKASISRVRELPGSTIPKGEKEEACRRYFLIREATPSVATLVVPGRRVSTRAATRILTHAWARTDSFQREALKQELPQFLTQEDPGALADSIAARIKLPHSKKLELLEQRDKSQRLIDLNKAIDQQLNNLQFEREINEKVRQATKKEHREIFLREQLKQVLTEIGDAAPLALYNPIFQGRGFAANPALVFVLMPFHERFRPIYDEVIKPVVKAGGLQCVRADDLYGAKPIVEDIWRSLNEARLVIADLSGKNPNVFYEVGLAHAIGKDVVFISQSLDDIPFDLRHLRCVLYSDSVAGFRKLEKGLIGTLANYPPPKAEA
jgi:hypothetical protein